MDLLIVYVATVFLCGLAAWAVRLPPLIGFLAAGFILNAQGVEQMQAMEVLADIGVTLMLFAIGLRLDLKALTDKAVWFTAGAHIVIMTAISAAFITALNILGAFGPTDLQVAVRIGVVLAFSSTIVVIKILQDRGDEQSLYGNICVGILIMQDIAAVVFISILRGEAPSAWSLSLVLIIPLLMVATRRWYKLGHGELGALFGIAMALIPGYALFEFFGLSGSLGALIMGLVLARSPGAEQLSHALFTFKELMLVAFFVNVGFMGLPTMQNLVDAFLLLLLIPIQAILFWAILWYFGPAQPHSRAGSASSGELFGVLAHHRRYGSRQRLAGHPLDALTRLGGFSELHRVRCAQPAVGFPCNTSGSAPAHASAPPHPP